MRTSHGGFSLAFAPREPAQGGGGVNKPNDRRNFIKSSLAATGAAWAASAWPALLNASEMREGLNISRLEELKDQLAARNTTGLLIRRHNRTVYEWYAPGWGPERPQLHSLNGKIPSVGGMSLLVALNDGRIGADDPAWKYIPQWKQDPLKSRITIRQLATHTSGLEDAEEGGKPHAQLTGWKGDFWKRKPNPFWIAIHETPAIYTPGTKFAYSNPGFAALAYAITAGLRGAPQQDIYTLLKERVMGLIGILIRIGRSGTTAHRTGRFKNLRHLGRRILYGASHGSSGPTDVAARRVERPPAHQPKVG